MQLKRLYQLIQTLDKEEENHLSKCFHPYRKKQYVILYKFLLKEGLKQNDLLKMDTCYRHNYRNLLKNILEELRNLNYERKDISWSKQAKNLLKDARFLFEKGIYEYSWKELIKAKNKAKEVYQFSSILEANRMMMDIILFSINNTEYQLIPAVTLEELHKETVIYTKLLEVYSYHKIHYTQLSFLSKKKYDSSQIDQLKSEFSEYIAEKPKSPLCLHRHMQAQIIYYRLIKDTLKASSISRKALNWWELPKNEQYKKEEAFRYILSRINFISLLIESSAIEPSNSKEKNYKEVEQHLKIVEQQIDIKRIEINDKHPDNLKVELHKDWIKIQVGFIKCTLNYAGIKKDLERCERIFANTNILETRLFSIKDQKILLGLITQIYFMGKNYIKSYKYFNILRERNTTYTEVRIGIYPKMLIYGVLNKIYLNYKGITDLKGNLAKMIAESKQTPPQITNYCFTELLNLLSNFSQKMKTPDFPTAYTKLETFIQSNKNNPYAEDIIEWLSEFLVGANRTT